MRNLIELFDNLVFEDKPLEAHGNTSNRIEPVDPLQHSNVADKEGVQGVLSQSNRTRDGDPDSKRQYVNVLAILNFLLH